MPSPSDETKIELVTEAIEALVLAVIVAAIPSPSDDSERAMHHKNVVDGRAAVAKALATCLAPGLRIVASNRHKDICTKDRCYCGSQ